MQFCLMKQTISTILPNVIMDIENFRLTFKSRYVFLKIAVLIGAPGWLSG